MREAILKIFVKEVREVRSARARRVFVTHRVPMYRWVKFFKALSSMIPDHLSKHPTPLKNFSNVLYLLRAYGSPEEALEIQTQRIPTLLDS